MPRKTPQKKSPDPLVVIRKAVDTLVKQVSRHRLALAPDSIYAVDVVEMCEVTDLLIEQDAREGRGPMVREALTALENEIAARLDDKGRALLTKFSDELLAYETRACDAGYMLGVEVGRRLLSGGPRC